MEYLSKALKTSDVKAKENDPIKINPGTQGGTEDPGDEISAQIMTKLQEGREKVDWYLD